MANALDCNIVVNRLKLQSCYYIHFWKGMNSLTLSSYGLNSTTSAFLQEWIWHEIIHKSSYAIKQINETKPNIYKNNQSFYSTGRPNNYIWEIKIYLKFSLISVQFETRNYFLSRITQFLKV